MQGLCSISAHLWAISDFAPLCLGIPKNAIRWGAASNSGREWTRGCYALKQKYHSPCPPPLQFFSLLHLYLKVISAISRHICRGVEPPRPL